MDKSMTVYLGHDNNLVIAFCRGDERHNYRLPLEADFRMSKRAFALKWAGYTCRPYTGALGYVMEKKT